ncbi:hypothetical protein L596_000853 [Steinernema carpocapsae]|uniref:Uncharacterized protein n=1 Tax=Steinernema carpocapsae TaxID=34508 RepID=A0A4U8UJY4_STECR|nr:hypothetical protein L596_000853 [Steinernema carpocapsae]
MALHIRRSFRIRFPVDRRVPGEENSAIRITQNGLRTARFSKIGISSKVKFYQILGGFDAITLHVPQSIKVIGSYYVAIFIFLLILCSNVDWIEVFAPPDSNFDLEAVFTYLDLKNSQFVTPKRNISYEELVIVSAFSYNHAKEESLFCQHFETHKELKEWQKWRLVIYTLGDVSPYMIDRIGKKCPKAEFRKFDFSIYPRYVQRLKEYRWKHLIAAEMLKESPLVFYGDSSARVNMVSKTPFKNIIDEALSEDHVGVSLFRKTVHSIYQATNPLMYPYLNITTSQAKQVTMHNASPALWLGTAEVKTQILREMVRCSLTEDCMGPPGSRISCTNNEDSNVYSYCHRYDQSALNILLAQNANFQLDRYISKSKDVCIRRGTKV